MSVMQAGQGNTNVCGKFVRTMIKDKEVKKVKTLYRPKWPMGPVLNSGSFSMNG